MLPHTIHQKSFRDGDANQHKRLRFFMVLSGVCAITSIVLLREHYALNAQISLLENNLEKRGEVVSQLQEKLQENEKNCESKAQDLQGKLSELGIEREQLSENCQQKEKRFLDRISYLETELDHIETKLSNCSKRIASYSDKCNEKIQEQYQKHADSEHKLENCQNELSNVKTQNENCQRKYTEALKIIKSLRGSNFDQPPGGAAIFDEKVNNPAAGFNNLIAQNEAPPQPDVVQQNQNFNQPIQNALLVGEQQE
ncbi:uncharacterized protein LOC142342286 [Convolutriloba macropyga]|uniref:uncharacterized protein LOC142342286 n=1 Tax=Convolutriloba macropyga TaxID=536237 RepID=UPI003F51BCB6